MFGVKLILILALTFSSSNCHQFIYKNENKLALAMALSDIIKEIYVKNSVKFDLIFFNQNNSDYDGIMSEINKKSPQNYAYSVVNHINLLKNYYFNNSAIIFCKTSYELVEINKKAVISSRHFKFLRLLMIFDVNYQIPHEFIEPKLSVLSGHISQNQYFLINSNDSIKLLTTEWFSDEKCNEGQLIIINSFNKSTLMWKNKLEDYKKFRNFHKCPLKHFYSLSTPHSSENTNFYLDRYDLKGRKHLKGFKFDIFNILAKKGNFVAQFEYKSLNAVSKITFKQVELRTSAHIDPHNVYRYITTPHTEFSFVFLLTPGELLSPYEKLFLPFDRLTWICLIITFTSAFTTIMIASHLPRRVQQLLFGERVRMPAYNVLGTFFGISQLQLPTSNFPRIILMFFILFCLIIRTAYQGVFFEIMTTDPRKSLPLTIEDLYFKNFTVYSLTVYKDKADYPDVWFDELNK